MDDGAGSGLLFILVATGLALIPASIASGKGRNFALWYIYGFLIFIVAIIHAIVLKSPQEERAQRSLSRGTSDAEELERFAHLRDQGVITETEFQNKKREILSTG